MKTKSQYSSQTLIIPTQAVISGVRAFSTLAPYPPGKCVRPSFQNTVCAPCQDHCHTLWYGEAASNPRVLQPVSHSSTMREEHCFAPIEQQKYLDARVHFKIRRAYSMRITRTFQTSPSGCECHASAKRGMVVSSTDDDDVLRCFRKRSAFDSRARLAQAETGITAFATWPVRPYRNMVGRRRVGVGIGSPSATRQVPVAINACGIPNGRRKG